jgi:glycosyltransferase involved in cell wall biosynthesis
MKVSICCITYNQERFIAQALDSFLMQRTNFDFEIVIGDDFSKDNTNQICIAYKNKYPKKIKLISNAQNIGMTPNFVQTLKYCQGEYIALCEGDDYWTDSHKLQKQADFLDSHSQYVGCFHNTEERYDDDENKPSYLYCNFSSGKSISFEDLSFGNLMPTCSVMYRNSLKVEFPEWFFKLKMADWPLHLLYARFGPFWYIPKIMGVHRLHSESVWMLQDSSRNNQFVVEAYEEMIKGYYTDKIHLDKLIKAKTEFIKAIKLNGIDKEGLKQKIKRSIIYLVNKF